MAFDILGYRNHNKNLYGDASLEDVAKDAFSKGGYDKEYSDYDTWKKAKGIDSIIQDDLNTRKTPETSSEGSSLLRRGIRDPLLGLTKGLVVGVPETIMGLADIPTLGGAGKLAEEGAKAIGLKTFKEANALFDERLSPEAQLSRQKVAETKGFIPTIKTAVENPSSIVQTVMESLMPMFVGGKGLGLLFNVGAKGLSKAEQLSRAVLAGGVSEGAITTGQGLEQVRQETPEGVLTPKQVGLGIVAGATTGALGVLGGKIANLLKINDINTMLAGGTQQKTKLIKSLFAGAFQEGLLEELPQSMQEQIMQNLSLDKPPLEGIPEAGAMGLLAGIAQSVGATSLGKAREQFTQSKTHNPDYSEDIEKLKMGADLVGIIHTGLLTGKINEAPFTPQDAMDIIHHGRESGVFDDHDISVFKELFPQLKDNLNSIITESIIEKIKPAIIPNPTIDLTEVIEPKTKSEIPIESASSEDLYRDMIPGAEESYKKPNIIAPPKESEIWYRGQAEGTILSEDKPIFFTRNSNDAEWFKNERRVEGKSGEIYAANLKMSNPAHLRDLIDVVNGTKSVAEDVQSNSPYSGEDIIDYLYVPKVREELKKRGFDGYVGFDVLENKNIDIAVPFSLTSITSKSQGISNVVSDLQTQLTKQYPKSGVSLSTIVRPDGSVGMTLNSLRLSENERGQGTGTKIVGQIKEYADKNKLKIEVHPQSQLIKFYEKQGFVKEREGVWTYQTPSKDAKAKVAPVKVAPVKVATVKVEVPITHILPKELHQAKPRYSYGSNQFNLVFENDLDKAAYITAQNTKSKSDEAYVQFVRNATGLSDMAIRSYGQKVKDHIKSVARSAVNGSELKIPNLGKDILAKSKTIDKAKSDLNKQTEDGKAILQTKIDELKKTKVDQSKSKVEEPKKPKVEEPKKPKVEEPKKPKVEEPKKPKVEEPKKPKVEEPKKPKVEEPKKSKKPKYDNSLQSQTNLPVITLKEVQDIFKGQEVIQPGGINSPIYIKTSGGQYLTIESVTQITPNEMAFEIAYGRPYNPDIDFLAGVYESGTIQLVRGSTGKLELVHESIHYMEDVGIINENEVRLLQRHIQNLVQSGKFDSANKDDIGGQEDRANFLANELTKNKPQGLLGRIILKIQDFIDKLVNAFGHRTIKGITRDIESGEIYKREGVTPENNPELYALQEKLQPFFSQLNKVTDQKMGNKMPVDQLIKMLKSNGVTDAEINNLIGGIRDEGGTVTKQQVLDEIKVNTTQFRDVVLGGIGKSYQDILNAEVSRANNYLQKQNKAIREEASRIGGGDPIDLILFAQVVADLKERVGDYKVSEEFMNVENSELPVQFEYWSEPGYKPGSYREMFVTAPPSYNVNNMSHIAQETSGEFKDWYQVIRSDGRPLNGHWRTYEEASKVHDEMIPESEWFNKSENWQDGHEAYSDIQNPIVRIRYNDRMINGKRILFIEEIQGPGGDTKWVAEIRGTNDNGEDIIDRNMFDNKKSAQNFLDQHTGTFWTKATKTLERTVMGEQGKMPPAFQQRIYDIGVKRVLALAKEGGYDGIAWTTGQMQADRYNLSKQIDSVNWTTNSDFNSKLVRIDLKRERDSFTFIIVEGHVVDNSGSTPPELVGKSLEEVVGKDLAKRILSEDSADLTDLDLKIGGEGLIYLYDKQIPSLMKKYGKENVSTIKLQGNQGYRIRDDIAYDKIIDEFNIAIQAASPTDQGALSQIKSDFKNGYRDIQPEALEVMQEFMPGVITEKNSNNQVTLDPQLLEYDRYDGYDAIEGELEDQIEKSTNNEDYQQLSDILYNFQHGTTVFSGRDADILRELMPELIRKYRIEEPQNNIPYVPITEKTPASYPQYAAQQKPTKNTPPPWDVDPPSRIDKFLRIFTDRFIDLRRVIDEISKLHGQLADAQDPSLQQVLYSAKVKDGIDHFLRDELRPLLRELQEKGGTLEGLHEFILNRHAPEANAYIASINPRLPDEGSGIKTQDAIDYMKNLNPTDKAMYDSLAKRYDAIAKKNLQLLVSNGLESQKTINTWLSKYQYYAPLYRSDMEKDGGFGTGRGFSVVGPSSKTRHGSTREVSNVIASLAEQRERYLTRIAKNNIDTAIVALAEKYPNPDFWSLAKPSITSKVSADPTTKGQLVKVVDLSYMQNDNVIMSRSIDPKTGDIVQRGVEFHLDNERAKEMVKALKNLDMDKLGMVLSMSAKVTRFISSMNTQYNIVFGVVNFVRDFQSAMFNLSTTEIAGKQTAVAKGVFPALQAIYKDLRAEHTGRGGVVRTQIDQDWQDFRAHGGLVGYRDMYRNREDRINAIKNEMAKVSAGATKQVGHYLAQWLSDYNTTIEAGIRLSAYRVGIQNGMTKDRAAAMAKNLTLDFNKKGQISLQAGALYAFFNATAQGGVRLYETLAGPAGKKIIAGGIMVGVLQALMIAASDLDDNEPPEYVRERTIVIPIGDKKYLTIPMALGFHILPGIGRISTEWALGGFEHPVEKFSNLLGTFIESFNPMGSAGMTLQTISPSPMDPIVALAENKDWTGRPIFKEDMNKLQPTPGFSRAKDAASGFSKSISWALNRLSGGSQYNPGFFSPTPDQIDYLAGQVGGGVTREAIKVVQAVGNIGEKEHLPSHKLPLISRFYGAIEDENHEKTQYYNNIKKFNEHELEIKGLRKDGKSVQDYIKNHPESRFVNIANKIDADITKLKKRKKILTDRGAEKEIIERVDHAIILHMKRLNDAVNAHK